MVKPFINAFISLLLGMVALSMMTVASNSAELIMLEQDACPWCERWHEEIGVVYNKTSEGQIAPLRVVNIHDNWPEDLEGITPDRFTPTFILVENGKEVDRMRGYTGDEFFWFLVGEMIKKLPNNS